jgi:hypothetical protein
MPAQPHQGLSSETLYALWRRGPSIPEIAAKIGKTNAATRMALTRIDRGEKVECERDILAALHTLYDSPKESEEW